MITLHNLSFHYKNDITIFDNINTTISPGHIYGLLGLNGVGKTTLLKLICGLLFPKAGTVTTHNFTPSDREVVFLSDIYFVTDEVELPPWSISNFLAIYSPLYPKFDRSYFDDILEAFQVDQREKIKSLSYGQRKKVNIAFALAANTRILLMDEPTNGLDIPSKTQFRKLLARHVSSDRTIMISTHQIRDIHHLIDHLLILQDTRLVLDESVYKLGKKIKFEQGDCVDALYSETSIHGKSNILPNTDDKETPFDIELFFNAISSQPDLIKKLANLNLQNHE